MDPTHSCFHCWRIINRWRYLVLLCQQEAVRIWETGTKKVTIYLSMRLWVGKSQYCVECRKWLRFGKKRENLKIIILAFDFRANPEFFFSWAGSGSVKKKYRILIPEKNSILFGSIWRKYMFLLDIEQNNIGLFECTIFRNAFKYALRKSFSRVLD